MIKEMIKELNNAMYDGEITFDCAKRLLKQLSTLTGKDYCIISKRVCYKAEDGFHDAWVNA